MTGEDNYIKSYEELRIWQDVMALVEQVYALCKTFPKDEVYGLTSQLKRAVISVPLNIAESSERNGTKELIQFLYVARGSLAEVQTQLELARRLGFAQPSEQTGFLMNKLSRGLASLIKSLQSKLPVTRHSSPVTSEKSYA